MNINPVRIIRNFETGQYNVYLVGRDFNGKRTVASVLESGQLEWKSKGEDERSDPTYVIEDEMIRYWIQAFEDLHMPGMNKSELKGRLDATERHLGDMRKLLKLPDYKETK